MHRLANPTGDIDVVRLETGDGDVARELFALMARVLGEPSTVLGDDYVARILDRPDFWAVMATKDGEVVGGVTAHTLMMTTSERSELLIFDLAVREDHHRTGIGRALVAVLREAAAASGITLTFVLADDDDADAIAFYSGIGGSRSGVVAFEFAPERSQVAAVTGP